MKAIHKEAILENDGVLIINNLPLKKGQRVDVQIQSMQKGEILKKYPLRGKSFKLIQPFDSVAEQDWNVL